MIITSWFFFKVNTFVCNVFQFLFLSFHFLFQVGYILCVLVYLPVSFCFFFFPQGCYILYVYFLFSFSFNAGTFLFQGCISFFFSFSFSIWVHFVYIYRGLCFPFSCVCGLFCLFFPFFVCLFFFF